MPRSLVTVAALGIAAILALAQAAPGADAPSFTVVIKDHRFEPAELTVPAGTAFTILVKNQDRTVEEFESRELKIEKIIPGGKEARIRVRPLKPGRYPFIGEFHEDSAKGVLIAQ